MIAFVGYTAPTGPDELPSYTTLSAEAAEYLASIPIRAFGTDGLGVDSLRRLYELGNESVGYERAIPVHHAFLPRGIPVVIGRSRVAFVGFPLKIAGGDGSPVRATAFVYE